jgi:predicted secreted protein
MGIASVIAIYLTVWWTVLFAVLPFGVQSHAEAGVDPQGGDPGSPVNPNLKRKFITTSWISAIIVAGLLALIHFQVIDLAKLPWRPH